MKYSFIIILLMLSKSYSQKENFSGTKIGVIKNNEYTITVDTLMLKRVTAKLITQQPDTLLLDKVEILKAKPLEKNNRIIICC